MRKQRGGGNCCGKSKSNRVKPILYPGIIEFTEVEVINQPSVSSDEESLKPESVILDMPYIPNYIPSIPMSIDNNKLTVTTYDHDHETTFETMPDDMIRVINTYLLPEFSSTDCTFNTNLMITSKNMNKILKESNENNISTAVNKYFNCPEFTALFEFFKTGQGWYELCVYPIVIFNNITCKTFEFHINVENKKINIYHFPHEQDPAPKKTSDSDVEKLIYEMKSCLQFISSERFKSIHFVTWAGDFSYNEDDDTSEDDNTPVYDDDDINEINATVKYNPEQISTKNIKIYSAVKLAFSKMINMINDQYTYTYLASLSLPHIMYMYSSLYTDDNKITLFKIDPENRGGARRRKLKLRMRS